MTLLLLAAALPGLFWDQGPQTAPSLRQAGVSHIFVPPSQLESWKPVPAINAESADLATFVRLTPPGVNYRPDEASASRQPWIDANGWKILRRPSGRFYYDANGTTAALAAAEAFCYGADALVHTDAVGLKPFAETLATLGPALEGRPVSDFGLIDDGSPLAGEVMNLLVRHNLLFKIGEAKMTMRLPPSGDPRAIVQKIRGDLGDDNRTVRIYGSSVVIARPTGLPGALRVDLLNYAGASRPVHGLRVRVLGRYPKHPDGLLDYTVEATATEFTLPELKIHAAIDLSQ